jgi:hypothetical protein
MNKLLLTLLASLLFTGSAWAEWVKVGSSTKDTFYFESSTIRVEGDKRKVWVLFDNKQRDRYGAFSARIRNEYDCKREKVQILSSTLHSEAMATGKTLSNDQYTTEDWSDIPPNTFAENLLKIVCAK